MEHTIFTILFIALIFQLACGPIKVDYNRRLGTEQGENLYEVLGIQRGATEDQITQAYKSLSREIHPDKLAPEFRGTEIEAIRTENFQILAHAKDTLLDNSRRAAYDKSLNDARTSINSLKRGVAAALSYGSVFVSGMLGTANILLPYYESISHKIPYSDAKCEWFDFGGTFTRCIPSCPTGWMNITEANGYEQHMPDFGSRCYSGRKSLCCKVAAFDTAFAGNWYDTRVRLKWSCTYTREGPYVGPCGLLSCHRTWGPEIMTNITTTVPRQCSTAHLDHYEAQGFPGQFALYDVNGQRAGFWIKFPP